MMNYIWAGMIVFSFVCAIWNGNMGALSNAVINGGKEAVDLCFSLTGMLCLWGGIMNVAEKSGFTKIISKILSPIFKILFKDVKNMPDVAEIISMNVTANMLGLGNASTPLGLEAMKRIQRYNNEKDTATEDMVIFVVMNSAAMRIIPTTVTMLRVEHNSLSPMETMIPTWICTALSLTVGITVAKLLGFFKRKAVKI